MCSICVQGSPFSYCADLAEVELYSEGWGCTVRGGAVQWGVGLYSEGWGCSCTHPLIHTVDDIQSGCIMPLVSIFTTFHRFLDASSKLVRVDETLTVSNAREQHVTVVILLCKSPDLYSIMCTANISSQDWVSA